LYEIVGVPRNAQANDVKDAYEARLRDMANRHDPEAQAERALLRSAFDVLFDPNQRARYDQRLRDEAMRAVASGVGDAPEPDASPGDAPSPLWRSTGFAVSITVLLIMAGAGWKHFDDRKKAEALRIERARLTAEQERIAREQAEQRQQQSAPGRPSQAEQEWEAREMERFAAEKRREAQNFQREQDAAARQREYEARQAAEVQRRAEYERQQQEQMDRQRAEQQLARERQMLQEIENSRRFR
jgi:curved DNA-binding protein CbpA